MTEAVSFQADDEGPAGLSSLLPSLDLGGWQYYSTVGSTNDMASAWAQRGALDWSLVIADEQTAGRGRNDRNWVTRPGSALAFSLVLRLTHEESAHIPRFTALAAMGLTKALEGLGLKAQIKWPNDILLAGKKVAGVLVEADWQDDALLSLVLGIGVNVMKDAVPEDIDLRYPAISVSQALGENVDRWMLLVDILKAMMTLRKEITGDRFMKLWNKNLAFKDQRVQMRLPGKGAARVKILGISHDGELIVERGDGDSDLVTVGEIGTPEFF